MTNPASRRKTATSVEGLTQIRQLSTPTYKDRKEKKTSSSTTPSSNPTVVDPAHISVLGKVEKVKVKAVQSTPSKKRSDSPKPSTSSKTTAEDLKLLDEKWSERFSRPFFEPAASSSDLPVEKTGPGLEQATDEAVEEMQTATQPLGSPGARIATQPVQAPGSFPEVQPTGEGDVSATSDSEVD